MVEVKVGLRDVFENTASGEVGVEDPQPSSSVSKKAILFEFRQLHEHPCRE